MASNLATQVGVTSALAKSYAYDEPQYVQADPINFTIAAAGSSSVKFTSFTTKQLKSVTIVPTVAPTANDQLQLQLVTLGGAGLAFGTATTVNYTPAAIVAAQGTVTATGSNTITLSGVGNGLAAGQTFPLGTCPAYNPCYFPVAGGTYAVVVANGAGTNTQTSYVFPSGPSGGLTLSAGDVLTISKGTDTVGVYQGEAEFYFTPGSNVTK